MHAVGSVVDRHLKHVRGPEANPHGRAGIDLSAVPLRPSRHEISVVRCAIESEKKPCRAHRLTVYRGESAGTDPAYPWCYRASSKTSHPSPTPHTRLATSPLARRRTIPYQQIISHS